MRMLRSWRPALIHWEPLNSATSYRLQQASRYRARSSLTIRLHAS